MTEMEPPGEISEGTLGSGEIQTGSLPQSGMLPGIAKLEMDSNEDPELEERRRKKKRQKRLEEIDLAMKMETTRYLLKARTAYQQ